MVKNEKMKAGEFKVTLEQEEALWTDRKRTVFGLPWSFTKYTLTPTKIILNAGLLRVIEEEVKLYRITDISYSQTLGERLFKVGSLCLFSNDSTMPCLYIQHVKQAKRVKELLSHYVEKARRAAGVRTSELVGGGTPTDTDTLQPDLDGDGFPDNI